MFDKIRKGLKKKEARVFMVFLFFSTLIWFISKLSNTFEGASVFNLEYVNIPTDQMLIQASHDRLEVQLEALGFNFLGMSISRKEVQIDVSETIKKAEESFILKADYKKQIENQIPSSMKLIEINNDTLFFDFQKIIRKKVPVKPRIQINLAQNYLLDGELLVAPDSVEITGPKNQVDSIINIKSVKIDLTKLTSNFLQKAALIIPEELTNTSFSNQSVTISGRVSKFSEKKLTLQIEILNLPRQMTIQTFPKQVDVICLGTLEVLKNLNVSDFQLVADYKSLKSDNADKLPLMLRKKPAKLYSAILEETEVEYIVVRK